MALSVETYALAKKFALKVAAGFSSVTVDEPTSTINFTLNDGTKVSLKIPQLRGIKDIYLEKRINPSTAKDETHLMMLMSDDTIEDAGVIPGADLTISKEKDNILVQKKDGLFVGKEIIKLTQEQYDALPESEKLRTDRAYFVIDKGGKPIPDVSVLQEDLVATQAIGSVTAGKKYIKGTELETIIRDMLIKIENPTVTLSLIPSKTLYDIVDEEITSITLTAKVTKKTYDVANVKFYVGDTLVETKDTGVSAGGTFNFTYTPATPIKANTTFKAAVADIKNGSGQSTSSVTFVGKSYYGIVAKDIGDPTEAEIKTLNKTLKASKGYVYNNIVCDFNKIVYAYPQSMGALTSIKDVVNNFNYTDSFTRTSVKIDDINYYCYTLTEPTGADGVQLTFA